MMYLQVVAGFILLLAGAEFLVRGAVALARRLNVSPLVIGMTVVAFGTSAPELVVSLNAALAGSGGIAIGNVVGSNTANVLLILGAAGMVRAFQTSPGGLTRDAVVLLGGSLAFVALAWSGSIGFYSGAILAVLFIGFLAHSYWREKQGNGAATQIHARDVEEYAGVSESTLGMWVAILGGLAALLYGSEILVEGGIALARSFGIPEEVIGLTLIAIGTSLPELAASVMAAFRGHSDVALGNVVGSNLFNILGIVGVVAMVTPLPVAGQILGFDIWVMLATTALLLPFMVFGARFGRGVGLLFLAAYASYIAAQAWGVSNLLPWLG